MNVGHAKRGRASLPALDALSQALEGEMAAVNAEILRRLESPVELIPQVAGYLIEGRGKRIRPLMTLASGAIFGADPEKTIKLAAAVELIHAATLLHDDVVDESAERRGKAAANNVFGAKASVLVGDFLFSRAFQMMVDCGSLAALKILSDASSIIAQGEVMQLAALNGGAITTNDYLSIIRAKTAALFAAACEVGPVLANAEPSRARAMAEYGLNLGTAFQIADDALDYEANEAALGKKTGDDFREGKITAPVILALNEANDDERAFWSRVLSERRQAPGDFQKAQEILKRRKAIDGAVDLAQDYGRQAQLALAEAPDNPLRVMLDDLADYAARRDR